MDQNKDERGTDKNHVTYDGKTYRRTMDPDKFQEQYESELDRREAAKKRRKEANKSK